MPRLKYEPLKRFLDGTPEHINELTLSFRQIELVIGDELPPGAYKYREGWANHKGFSRARGWLPDWRTGPVSVEEQWVTFKRAVGVGDSGSREPASKYDPLRVFLERAAADVAELTLSFQQIEAILDSSLPTSAREHRSWWANSSGHSQAKAWLEAGWKVETVDFDAEWVFFRRQN